VPIEVLDEDGDEQAAPACSPVDEHDSVGPVDPQSSETEHPTNTRDQDALDGANPDAVQGGAVSEEQDDVAAGISDGVCDGINQAQGAFLQNELPEDGEEHVATAVGEDISKARETTPDYLDSTLDSRCDSPGIEEALLVDTPSETPCETPLQSVATIAVRVDVKPSL